MSVWRDMAHDAGYRGDEAERVARMIEEQERERVEAKSRCCQGMDDVCVASGCQMGIPGGEDGV